MDVPKSKSEIVNVRRRRYLALAVAVPVLAAVFYFVGRLETAPPTMSREGLWVDTVRQGPMTRELQGVGELVPNDDAFRWVAAELDGRVDRKLIDEGAQVTEASVIVQLSNPDVEQAAVSADLALQAAEAAYSSLEASLQTEVLALRSAAAAIEAERAQAAIQADVDATLSRDGLLSDITSRQSTVRATALGTRARLEDTRVETTERSLSTRLATQRAEVESRRTLAALKHRDLAAMTVRAGMAGVLQEIVVEVGQRVNRSANLARIVDPSRLKAQLRIPEAQTDDLRQGLPVRIDTHNGIVPGHVARIAPAAQNGTVTVDVQLAGELPRGARPDMTVDGTIELERLDGVRHVGRPAAAQTGGTVALFKLAADGASAHRTTVKLGRASANTVEIIDGDLREGDRVVLSDTSAWGDHQIIRLR